MIRRCCLNVGLLILFSLVTVAADAKVKLPSIIGDGMVLQRDRSVPIWGWDDPGTEMTVTWGESTLTAKSGDDGKWRVQLPATPAGGPYELSITGTDSLTVRDVLVGEVWLCSGQSNMEWVVRNSNNPEEEIAAANHPQIRHIKIPHVPAATPQSEVASSGWQVCSPETVARLHRRGLLLRPLPATRNWMFPSA